MPSPNTTCRRHSHCVRASRTPRAALSTSTTRPRRCRRPCTSGGFLEQQCTSRQLQASLNLGQANLDNTRGSTWLSENSITLRRTLAGRHDFTVLGGFTAQETRSVSNGEQGVGFTSDQLGYASINAADRVTGTSSLSRSRLASFLARVNYGFAGKYLVTGTIRGDGSSKFAVNNKWATLPSVAVAWRVSDEPFFRRLAPAEER